MAKRTSVEVDGGIPVVRQVADVDDGAGVARLEALGRRLTAVAGPAVVEVRRSCARADGGWELVTVHGGTPLDLVPVAGAHSLARVLAGAAEALAAVHAAGSSHGDLGATDVVVGADGRARLCGLASEPGSPEDDVQRLGRIGEDLAARLTAGPEVERLRSLLVLAAAPDPARRPAARRLAADLAALGSVATASPAHRGHRPAVPRPSRLPVVPLAAALAVVVLAAVVLLRPPAREPGGETRREPTAAPPGSQGEADRPERNERPDGSGRLERDRAELPGCVASAGQPVDAGAGCAHELAVDGGAVVVDGERWVVGRPGDELLVGDWACAGRPRVARLVRGTGEVVVLDLPAGAGAVVERAERVDGASGLEAVAGEGGCLELRVRTDGGAIRFG